MMSESLAEYSALRVAQKKYGDAQMHKFLAHELDGYLRGRSNETRKRAAAWPGTARGIRLVPEGQPGVLRPLRLHRRRQAQPRPA